MTVSHGQATAALVALEPLARALGKLAGDALDTDPAQPRATLVRELAVDSRSG